MDLRTGGNFVVGIKADGGLPPGAVIRRSEVTEEVGREPKLLGGTLGGPAAARFVDTVLTRSNR